MNKVIFAASFIMLSLMLVSCGGAHGDNPGHAYMPDMYYSRAYETYGYNDVGGEYDSLRKRGIHYTGLPVPGTIARGDKYTYHLTGDSAGMAAAQALRNPLDSINRSKDNMKEAERLFLVNCAICHGAQLDGNGPLYNSGNGPYPVAPRNLKDAYTVGLTDGHIFHVITYGIRSMGAYGSQLTPEQRWWVISYIRSKQGGGAKPGADSTAKAGAAGGAAATGAAAKTDTTKTK